jgi:hypothetical protein
MVEHELTDEEVAVKPGASGYAKARLATLFKKLDARPKKTPIEPVATEPTVAPVSATAPLSQVPRR